MQKSHQLILLLFAFASLFLPSAGQANSVAKRSGKKILVQLSTLSPTENERYFVVDPQSQKKKGLIQILKIKNKLATAKLLKGTASPGYNLEPMQNAKKAGAPKAPEKGTLSIPTFTVGVLTGLNMDTLSVKLGSNTTATLQGMSFALKPYLDYYLTESIAIRGLLGFDSFNAKGGNQCGGPCTAEITYISADVWGRYVINSMESKYPFWVGAGIVNQFVMGTPVSTALNTSKLSITQVFSFGAGLDYRLSDEYSIPFVFDYGLLPGGAGITGSQIGLRAGFSYNF